MTHPEPISTVATTPSRRFRARLGLAISSILLACFAFLIYVVALLVTLPVSALRDFIAIPDQVTGLYGGVGVGRATLRGGYSLDWQLRGWPLLRARGVADWTLQGPDTLITGVATVTPRSFSSTDILGRAGPGLLALFPDLAVENCTSRAVVDVQEVTWARRGAMAAAGLVSLDAGSCDFLGRTTRVPQMTLDLSIQQDDAIGTLRDNDGRLAQVTVSGDRRIIVRIEPEGATLIPGMPTGGPMVLEYPF